MDYLKKILFTHVIMYIKKVIMGGGGSSLPQHPFILSKNLSYKT